MLTVKFMKYGPNDPDSGQPTYTEGVTVREAKAVHTTIKGDRTHVQLGDAPEDTYTVDVGGSLGCSFQRAYVMNEAGCTIEVIN